jgi:hypothetical protein
MSTQTFARIWGVLFIVIGIAGFVPGLTAEHYHPDVTLEAGLGLALGAFPVNVAHNAVHVLFGIWGLWAARSMGAAALYGKVVGVTYALFTILGLIPAAKLWTVFGLVPLYGHNIWLHALLATVAIYYGFAPHERVTVEGTP